MLSNIELNQADDLLLTSSFSYCCLRSLQDFNLKHQFHEARHVEFNKNEDKIVGNDNHNNTVIYDLATGQKLINWIRTTEFNEKSYYPMNRATFHPCVIVDYRKKFPS